MGWEELGGAGGVEELVGEDEEGGGDKTPPSTGGTATGEAFGEGLVEAITAQIFPQKQNVLVQHFHHHQHSKFLSFPETNATQIKHQLKISIFRSTLPQAMLKFLEVKNKKAQPPRPNPLKNTLTLAIAKSQYPQTTFKKANNFSEVQHLTKSKFTVGEKEVQLMKQNLFANQGASSSIMTQIGLTALTHRRGQNSAYPVQQ